MFDRLLLQTLYINITRYPTAWYFHVFCQKPKSILNLRGSTVETGSLFPPHPALSRWRLLVYPTKRRSGAQPLPWHKGKWGRCRSSTHLGQTATRLSSGLVGWSIGICLKLKGGSFKSERSQDLEWWPPHPLKPLQQQNQHLSNKAWHGSQLRS